MQQSTNKSNSQLLWQYAGLTTQLLIALGLGVFAGLKLDHWLKFSMPVLVWVLPLVILTALIIKVIKDTSRKNKV